MTALNVALAVLAVLPSAALLLLWWIVRRALDAAPPPRERAAAGPAAPATFIELPRLCHAHVHDLLVQRLQIPEEGPRSAAITTAQLLLLQRAMADHGVWRRAAGRTSELSLVLAEIGCLACRYPFGFEGAVLLLGKGLSHAAAVAQGRAIDPDWPVPTVSVVP